MAFPRAIIVAFMLSLFLLALLGTEAEAESAAVISPVAAAPGNSIDCGAECGRRCSKTSRPNRCKRACLSCCHTCNCVPPGTAGNKDVCPCYANLLNPKNGVHKCP